MILDNATLQYWHSRFNYMFFENALEPAIIKTYPETNDDEDTQAQFYGIYEPFAIEFYYDISDNDLTMYTLTVLLHEMVHQYCNENGIEDIDCIDDSHSDEFREEAENHGLTMNGYALTEWAKELINKEIKAFDAVCLSCDQRNERGNP